MHAPASTNRILAGRTVEPDQASAVVGIHRPGGVRRPLVVSSPHSGTDYPVDFLRQSKLDPLSLRRSEDSFVDLLVDCAPSVGGALVRALFPRAFVDVNREPYELDPTMFRDPLPPHANTRSIRVLSGLGTIARVVADGAEIYNGKLPFAEAEQRIAGYYRPFHAALDELMEETIGLFGGALLVDCHSMPSPAAQSERDTARSRPDIVLGDRFGMSCAPEVTDLAERTLSAMGYRVGRNDPYAGGFITHFYGKPRKGRHALQIEINRALYMDEVKIEPHQGFASTRDAMTHLVDVLARIDSETLRPQ